MVFKNNGRLGRFNIESIVISHYRIAETIYFLIEKTFPKFRMKFMFIIVGNGYVILYLSTTW